MHKGADELEGTEGDALVSAGCSRWSATVEGSGWVGFLREGSTQAASGVSPVRWIPQCTASPIAPKLHLTWTIMLLYLLNLATFSGQSSSRSPAPPREMRNWNVSFRTLSSQLSQSLSRSFLSTPNLRDGLTKRHRRLFVRRSFAKNADWKCD